MASCFMESFLIVLVVLVLLGAIGIVGYQYRAEAGPGASKFWLTGSQRMRQAMESGRNIPRQAVIAPSVEPLSVEDGAPRASAVTMSDPTGESLRSLREEVLNELRDATGRSREFDARLAKIEFQAQTAPNLSDEVQRAISDLRTQQQVDLQQMRVVLRSVKVRAGTYGQRRGEALSSLYTSLARVESSLASVVNPMLLPGESLTLPPELPAEAMIWSNWSDVGEAAYALGDVFNRNRLVLDAEMAEQIGGFVTTLRQALTGSVYPIIRDGKPTADRVAQMRSGLDVIVKALPVVRRDIERAYRADIAATDTEI